MSKLSFLLAKEPHRKLLDIRPSFRADFAANSDKYCMRGMYRVFDNRMYYYKKEYFKTNSFNVMRHLLEARNLGLVAFRQQSQDGFQHIFVTKELGDKNAVSLRTREVNYYFPLYLLPEVGGFQFRTSPSLNFSAAFLKKLGDKFRIAQTGDKGLPKGLAPEDIIHYIYGVFHSPGYRSRYAEFLKIDFPRLPLTENLELFRSMSRIGGELVALHLMESPETQQPYH